MFEGNHVRLRAYSKEDLPKAQEYLNNPKVGASLRPTILFPYRLEDEESWYNTLNANSTSGYNFAIERKEDAAYMGGCGVHQINAKNRHVSVGIFLGHQFWGKGYGTDAMRVLVDFCFQEINLHKVKLEVFSYNERAIRSYQKVGFIEEGVLREEVYRHGKYHDCHLMSIFRKDWTSPFAKE